MRLDGARWLYVSYATTRDPFEQVRSERRSPVKAARARVNFQISNFN